MDIFDYAIKMEEDGEKFYRDMAAKTKDTGIKNILNMLADDEVKHKEILDGMKENNSAEMKETEILTKSKNIFEEMRDNKVDITSGDEEIDLYREAKEIETRSIEFYKKKSGETEDENVKKLLLQITDEEKRHYFLLDNIEELLLRPKQWVEDAEFNHLEDY